MGKKSTKGMISALVAQGVKDPPAMQEMQEVRVRSLGPEDPLEEEMAIHSSILAWKNSMDRGAWKATYSPWGIKESDTTEHARTNMSTVVQ